MRCALRSLRCGKCLARSGPMAEFTMSTKPPGNSSRAAQAPIPIRLGATAESHEKGPTSSRYPACLRDNKSRRLYRFNVLTHSVGGGYQVEYYPQYRYSPVVFGSTLTNPEVQGRIKVGHYHFQGWHNQ